MRFLLYLLLLLPLSAQAVEVREVVSDGGITAWLVEEHTLPLLSVNVVFRDAGSASDPAGREGRASFVSDMMLEGAGARDGRAFARAVEENGLRLSINVSDDLLSASLQTLTDKRETAFALLGDALARPRFAADAVTRVRTRTLTSLKSLEQSPHYALSRAFAEAAYPGHPYARPGDGTPESVKALSPGDFDAYHKRYVTRGNLVVAVVGDITPEALKPLLDKSFSSLPAAFAPERAITDTPAPKAGVVEVARDIPQTLVAFGLQGVKRSDPDYMAAYVMNYILGEGTLTARLGRELRQKRGLTYGIDTGLTPQLHGGLWQGDFSTRAKEAPEAIRLVRHTIAEFVRGGPTEVEMEDAKRYLAGSFPLNIDSNGEIASYLISMQLYGLGRDYLKLRNAQIAAVTKEDVMRVAARLLREESLAVVTVGPKLP